MRRQEQAIENPEELSQDKIVQNVDPKEWDRLSRVRNIGIAVSPTAVISFLVPEDNTYRRTLIAARPPPLNASSSTLAGSTRFTRSAAKIQLAQRWTQWT